MSIRKNIIISLCLAVVASGFIISAMRKTKAPFIPELFSLDEQKFDVKNLEGKVYILSYFQTWCSDCVKEQPELLKLQEKFGKDKLVILMISDEPVEKIKAFKEKFNSGLSFYRSGMALKSKEVGVKRFPTTYLISKKGKVKEQKVEGIEWYTPEIISMVEKLLSE